ncbi:MAG: hypothetical protein LBK61_10140 [Spirochaetaceae bacterium]|jgi:hypothetical protein|nr:hypothetical protein [Spirochaetaceae bacterium]
MAAAFEATGDGNGKNHLTPMAVADRGYGSVQDIAAGMEAGLDIHVAGMDYDICVPAEEGAAEIGIKTGGACMMKNGIPCCARRAMRRVRPFIKGKARAAAYSGSAQKRSIQNL